MVYAGSGVAFTDWDFTRESCDTFSMNSLRFYDIIFWERYIHDVEEEWLCWWAKYQAAVRAGRTYIQGGPCGRLYIYTKSNYDYDDGI